MTIDSEAKNEYDLMSDGELLKRYEELAQGLDRSDKMDFSTQDITSEMEQKYLDISEKLKPLQALLVEKGLTFKSHKECL